MRRWQVFGLLGLGLLFAGPLLWLAASALGQGWPGMAGLFSARKLALLWRSTALALVVCAGTMLLSYLIAWGFYRWHPPGWLFPGLMLLMVFVPPYIHAQSFIFLFDRLLAGLPVNFNGFWAAALSMCFAMLPIPSVLLYACMRAIPTTTLQAARLYRPGPAAFARVFLPLSMKGVAGGLAMVFILSFSEFTVPSIFGVNTYALDIFAEYSTSHSAARVFFHALPVLLFCLLFTLPASGAIRGLVLSAPRAAGDSPKQRAGGWFATALFLLGVAVLLPLANLFVKWGGPAVFAANLTASLGEAGNSLSLAALTLLAALPMALLGGVLIARSGRGPSRVAVFLCLLPVATPAGLYGIACVSLLRALRLTGTVAAPVLACALRLAPLGALVMAGFLGGVDNALFDAWRLYRSRPGQGVLRILFSLVRPGLLAAGCLIFALALADVGTILLTVPAGMNTLTIKIYNYLHYGASDVVASLCLAMLGATALVGAPVVRMLAGGGRPRKSLKRKNADKGGAA